MKINEIIKVVSQPTPSLSDFDIENAKQLTTAENIPLYGLMHLKDSNVHAYALKVGNAFVSIIIGKWGVLDGPALYIRRTYTLPKYRNKGLITALYIALHRRLKYKMVSDFEQSPETIAVWKKLTKILPVKVVNTKTHNVEEYSDVPEEEIFGMSKGYEDIRLVISEAIQSNRELRKMKELMKNKKTKFITDIKIPERPLIDTIILDSYNYTHPDNDGKYI